jgi:hypothetical protein
MTLQNLPKLVFWFENKPSGNPGPAILRFETDSETGLPDGIFYKPKIQSWVNFGGP